MSGLAAALKAEIAAAGPITIARFMDACLHDPRFGYYATRPSLGAGGDFLTAPEASQMFGELLGLFCVHEWGLLGRPSPFAWIELGPGRGALMADAWRAAALAPAYRAGARITLLETSVPLRAAQRETLAHVQPAPAHIDRLEDAPGGPALILANEFLDCLPARQFVRTDRGWCERLVGLNAAGGLCFGLLPAPLGPEAVAALAIPDLPEGAVFEVQDGLGPFVAALASRLHTQPGRALLIDYGYTAPEGADTLQAVRGHQKEHPLAAPGEADLTVQVDFSAISRLAQKAGLRVDGPAPQGVFLQRLGIAHRAADLAKAAPDKQASIGRQFNRLTAPDQMGLLFKVICLSSPHLPAPAGL